ncbi:MAG: UDP-N-acetylmuramate--L-alanine ligase [[Lactobacillus] timonensis]|jgi:UDP-N-acetylmuramate--alanine ligase|uniref:UDP-N-acetylmuramate--L-alanine ligase n=1 Tax=[Lactobacillus] timonensis TaxID=1970790 RepID=UPI00235511F5|nr:UDP-N-acetylmuramate--L-alanine ligase [[Lactobacillus] timonensis]MCI1925699.1 UDP-N-acetylmuramate--L-alanine ligase [[Lactobacillus] timonensis]MCI1957060.1 UDP-N-acetylmuramate--L-alanine ligase [[Lactobacillus] timonensis]MCI1969985.1 UDP-N-acetylmuramate--L-alanine ligase [[Lactobacillus] timonensis]MCI2006250.1 UDP-N-acetylmuramate--L-alanine ligase [[Lactobacillus] timonensis]
MAKTYYFVGIKGTGMASLARLLHDQGNNVCGSDIEKETFTQGPLEKAGIQIFNFDPANLKEGMIVVQGNAFGDDHPEIKRAHEMGLTVLSYPAAVEQQVEKFTSIGIAGAHGKTSTTGLLSHTLHEVAKTSYLIGDGVGHGEPDARFFVFEADEYRDHFLAYHPDYAIMTNIDFDHPDYFKDINDVRQSFEQFGSQVKKAVFAWGDDENLRQLKLDVPIYYYGTSDRDDFRAVNIKRTPAGSTYDAYFRDQKMGTFTIHLYGEHSVLNSLAVVAVAYMEHEDLGAIKEELAKFSGVKRRFSETDIADIKIIDDYAHHPSEIKATLDAARQKFPDKEIIAVFQPHTYSRLAAYLKDFGKVLSTADDVFVTPIFGSIREHSGKVSRQDLEDLVPGSHDIDMKSLGQLFDFHNAVVIFMGAGDIEKYEDAYKEMLKN